MDARCYLAMREYYDRRAPEYEDWWRATGLHAAGERSGWHEDVPAKRMDARVLSDGSRHTVFKRWFEPAQLVEELGGGDVVHAGRWFVAVRA